MAGLLYWQFDGGKSQRCRPGEFEAARESHPLRQAQPPVVREPGAGESVARSSLLASKIAVKMRTSAGSG